MSQVRVRVLKAPHSDLSLSSSMLLFTVSVVHALNVSQTAREGQSWDLYAVNSEKSRGAVDVMGAGDNDVQGSL